jgi:DNA-binding HxlR family transcriptional regulator
LTVCLGFIRGAWTANILWYLATQPRRFTELMHDLRGVSAKVLTQRLKRLEHDGLIARRRLDTSPPSVEYALTDLGESLQPALATLVAVGHRMKMRRVQVNTADSDSNGIG